MFGRFNSKQSSEAHVCDLELFFPFSNYFAVDTASAIAIALMTFGTMYPMSVYSGKVLLQVRVFHCTCEHNPVLPPDCKIVYVLPLDCEMFSYWRGLLEMKPNNNL